MTRAHIPAVIVASLAALAVAGCSSAVEGDTTTNNATLDPTQTSCAQWLAMSASDQSAMAAGIISSEQAGGHAKSIARDSLTVNITPACEGSKSSTVGDTAALIIYSMTVKGEG